MSSNNLELMEDATSRKEVKNSTRVNNNSNTPWYCYLEEAMRVFLRCLGFENHEYSTKSGEEKEVVVVDSSSSISSEKDGENREVNEPSDQVQDSSCSSSAGGGGGATDPAASSSTTDPDAAADLPSTASPALGSPAISVEDIATTASRRPSRPPINSGSGPQTN